MASKVWYCAGNLESCLGECWIGVADRMSGPFGDTPENLAHLLGEDCGSDTPIRVHTSNPVQTWMVDIAPDFVPEEVV